MRNNLIHERKMKQLYWEYLCILGNLDYNTQIEIRPLQYEEFKGSNKKYKIIDFLKKMLYNK